MVTWPWTNSPVWSIDAKMKLLLRKPGSAQCGDSDGNTRSLLSTVEFILIAMAWCPSQAWHAVTAAAAAAGHKICSQYLDGYHCLLCCTVSKPTAPTYIIHETSPVGDQPLLCDAESRYLPLYMYDSRFTAGNDSLSMLTCMGLAAIIFRNLPRSFENKFTKLKSEHMTN